MCRWPVGCAAEGGALEGAEAREADAEEGPAPLRENGLDELGPRDFANGIDQVSSSTVTVPMVPWPHIGKQPDTSM